MPYPIAHVMFFVLCICAAGVYTILGAIRRRELSSGDTRQILFLLFVGSLCALFPDLMAVYSILVHGTLQHCWIGPIATHSLLFSSSAILLGLLVGYVVYRNLARAVYLSIFAESAFLSHLLLDDLARYDMHYFHPIYKEPISVFSYVDAEFASVDFVHYLLACYVSIFSIFVVMMMALFALDHLGFEFRYRSEK